MFKQILFKTIMFKQKQFNTNIDKIKWYCFAAKKIFNKTIDCKVIFILKGLSKALLLVIHH